MRRIVGLAIAPMALIVLLAKPASAVPVFEPGAGKVSFKQSEGRAVGLPERAIGLPEVDRIARTQIGAPYSYGGTTPAGFDCSGFTSWVYAHVGITLPHSSAAQYALGGTSGFTLIATPEELEVGDLVFHSTGGSGVGHVGIYVGDGQFISATSSEGIQIRSLSDSYWGPLWVGGVRVAI